MQQSIGVSGIKHKEDSGMLPCFSIKTRVLSRLLIILIFSLFYFQLVNTVFAQYGSIVLYQYDYDPNKCSYHFSTQTYGSLGDGEFYRSTGGKMYANNVGQQGLIDIGVSGVSVQFDPKTIDIPSTGYERFGVDPIQDHVYISLARKGEDNRYILFRVNYLSLEGKAIGLEYYILETGTIIVRTDQDGGFSIQGPRTYTGNGMSWQKDLTLTGDYTIIFDPISGYETPPSQTKSLSRGNTIVFEANYVLKPTNLAPQIPSQITGASSGTPGTSYTYSTSSTDPNNDQIKYTFDWGDGTQSTTDFVNSGSSASASHSWNNPGTYNIKAMATDFGGSTSGWYSTTVTIESTPQLSVSPDPLAFNLGTMKAGESSSQIFSISNAGGGTLTWSVSDDQPWITINPTSGADSGTITINIYTADLSPGSHSGNFIVTSDGGTKSGSVSFDIQATPPPTIITPTKPITGSIKISSDPSGASIYLDGVKSGETPKILYSVSAGDHLVELKLKDYENWSRIVKVEAGSSSTVAAPLTPGSSVELITPPGSQTTSPSPKQTSDQTSIPNSIQTPLPTQIVKSPASEETSDAFQWYSIIFFLLILAILASSYIIRKSRKTEPDEDLAKVEEWKKEGYDVSELDRSLKGKK